MRGEIPLDDNKVAQREKLRQFVRILKSSLTSDRRDAYDPKAADHIAFTRLANLGHLAILHTKIVIKLMVKIHDFDLISGKI